MEKLWYQREESLPAATPPNSVRTIQTPITGQRCRAVKCASRASRPVSAVLTFFVRSIKLVLLSVGRFLFDRRTRPNSSRDACPSHPVPFRTVRCRMIVAVAYVNHSAQIEERTALSKRRLHALDARLHHLSAVPRGPRPARVGTEPVLRSSRRGLQPGPVTTRARREPPHLPEPHGRDRGRARATRAGRAQGPAQRPASPHASPHYRRREAAGAGARGSEGVRTAVDEAARRRGAGPAPRDARSARR